MPALHVMYLFKSITIPKDWEPVRRFRNQFESGERNKVRLAHAGIVAIKLDDGLTKYYEYGRYDDNTENGKVRNLSINDLNMKFGDYPTKNSLAKLINTVKTNQEFDAEGSILKFKYYKSADYDKIINYVQKRIANEEKYVIGWNDCLTFADTAIYAGGHWIRTAADVTNDGGIYYIPFCYVNEYTEQT